jgi:hypothetical protein
MPYLVGLIIAAIILVWVWRAQTISAVSPLTPLGKVTIESRLFYDRFWGVCTRGIIACGPVMEPPFETYMAVLGMLLAGSVASWIFLGSTRRESHPSPLPHMSSHFETNSSVICS